MVGNNPKYGSKIILAIVSNYTPNFIARNQWRSKLEDLGNLQRNFCGRVAEKMRHCRRKVAGSRSAPRHHTNKGIYCVDAVIIATEWKEWTEWNGMEWNGMDGSDRHTEKKLYFGSILKINSFYSTCVY